MSAVNEGDIEINIYVFSETPVKDENDVLSVSQMIKIDNGGLMEKYNLTNENYVTLLKYYGDLDGLEKDSFFVEIRYDTGLDPTYVSLGDRVLNFAGGVFILLFYLLIFGSTGFIVFVLPPFVVGYLVERVLRNIESRYLHYASLALAFILTLGIYAFWFWHYSGVILLIPAVISLICGFYAARKESKRGICIAVLIALIIYLILVMFIL